MLGMTAELVVQVRDPDIAVVIPAFKQPLFMAEAIGSVLDQRGDLHVVAVVVDDGCPLESTRATAMSLAARFVGRVIYLRRENGGLSAARNSGIDFALAAWPGLKAIYFLDSDNRITPGFLGRAFARLCAAGAGWAYPDIDMFGVEGHYGVKGSYSALMHLEYNYCEAGSLVEREVFDRGLRFDETMKLGFEDWDFWLQAAEIGFRGVYVPQAGFCYRRRGESMLTQSERVRSELIASIRRKRKKILKIRNLLRLEAEELPRYRLVLLDRDEAPSLLDPAAWVANPGADCSAARFVEEFRLSEHAPGAYMAPRVMVVAHSETIKYLAKMKLVRYLFWLAELNLKTQHFMTVRLKRGAGRTLSVRLDMRQAGNRDLSRSDLLFVAGGTIYDIVRDRRMDWVKTLEDERPQPKVAVVEIELPDFSAPWILDQEPYAVVLRMLSLFAALREGILSMPALPMDWRSDDRMIRREVSQNLYAELGLGTVLPHVAAAARRQIGFLLPICQFGGVERVVMNYANTLKAAGFDCHLFVTEESSIEFSDLCESGFESVNFIPAAYQFKFDRSFSNPYLGAPPDVTREALGLLASMDVVFNTHALDMHGLIGEVRRLGAVTYVGLHLNETTPMGLPMGNATAALGYEHVYDGFVVISEDMRRWCLSQAVPAEKVHVVRNAPSYPIGGQELSDLYCHKAREQEETRALRVLYLGRLDAQKGIDRLDAIIRQTISADVEWRIVGKAVMGDASVREILRMVPIEPPVFSGAELSALYQWADVVVLPSRYEGVPLMLLEAQRLGSVVIATNVGAVAEIVDDEVDGFLVDGGSDEGVIVDEFVGILGKFAQDRALLKKISRQAFDRVNGVNWMNNMADFIAVMTRDCDAKAPQP
jgi:glycosyltransferase involved in cell wall biosynthesis